MAVVSEMPSGAAVVATDLSLAGQRHLGLRHAGELFFSIFDGLFVIGFVSVVAAAAAAGLRPLLLGDGCLRTRDCLLGRGGRARWRRLALSEWIIQLRLLGGDCLFRRGF